MVVSTIVQRMDGEELEFGVAEVQSWFYRTDALFCLRFVQMKLQSHVGGGACNIYLYFG